jgi:hypothetical protein
VAAVIGLAAVHLGFFAWVWTVRHSRVVASEWLRARLRPGDFVARETGWDEALPLGTYRGQRFPASEVVDLELTGKDDAAKLERLVFGLSRAR